MREKIDAEHLFNRLGAVKSETCDSVAGAFRRSAADYVHIHDISSLWPDKLRNSRQLFVQLLVSGSLRARA